MIKIAIADDHQLFAQGVANLLKEEGGFEILGVFKNGNDLLNFLTDHNLDVLITDMNMPGMDGMALIENIKSRKIKVKVIVLSMYDDEKIFKECVKRGVDAYVLKDADPDELIYTINDVVGDRHILNYQRVLRQIGDDDGLYEDNYRLKFKLSKREIEVLKHIAQGSTNREVADILSLSIFTIETHRKHIHQKLGVSNSIELMKKTLEMHLW